MKKAPIIYLSVLILFGICMINTMFLGKKNEALPFPEPVQPVENDTYLIDLNTATVKELMQIPGVGESLATNIIQYRDEHGPFQEYGELLNVKGIGHKNIIVIMDYVRIK